VADLGQVSTSCPLAYLVSPFHGRSGRSKVLEEAKASRHGAFWLPRPHGGRLVDNAIQLTRHFRWLFLKGPTLTLSLYPVVNTPALSKELFFSPNIPEAGIPGVFLQNTGWNPTSLLGYALPEPATSQAREGHSYPRVGREHDGIFPRVQESVPPAPTTAR